MATRKKRRIEEGSLGKLRLIREKRDKHPLPPKVGEMFSEGGQLKPEYLDHRPAMETLRKYHAKAAGRIPANYEVSPGIRQAIQLPMLFCQLSHRHPWAVVWTSLKDGTQKMKYCENLAAAMEFHAYARAKNPTATIISRQRHYDIPPQLRGRLPKPWKWCPRCMAPRKFVRVDPQITFYAMVKAWSTKYEDYEWKERTLALMECPRCGCTNRDPIFRRSNQPWEIRKLKPGTGRAKKRR